MFLFLWCLHLQLRPFRLFDSGQPQAADYVLLLLWLLLLLGRNPPLPSRVNSFQRSLAWFVAYVVLVNGIWSLVSGDADILASSAFYVFNFIGCWTFIKLYAHYGKSFLKFTAGCICFALFVQCLAASGVAADFGGRESLFFANPNQLGYYVVLSLSIMWVCWTSRGQNPIRVPVALEIVSVCGSSYLMLLSQSRAGLAAIAAALLGRVFHGKRALVGILIVILALLSVGLESPLWIAFQDRIQSRRLDATQEFGIRGYDRLANHPKYLLFGAGQGGYDRFESELDGELHSSIGTILFSYGLLGTLLAGRMVRQVSVAAGVSSLVYLAPVFIYSLTHNGLRQLEMWWLMPLIICLNTTRTLQPRKQCRPLSHPKLWSSFPSQTAATVARWQPLGILANGRGRHRDSTPSALGLNHSQTIES
jgi:hypothetical protein